MIRQYRASFRGDTPWPIRWILSYPARLYLRYCPMRRGKGIIENFVIKWCIPRESQIAIHLPSGDQILMTGDEKIGTYLLIYKTFELAELRFCCTALMPGSIAIDVGANVGIFTLTFSRAVSDRGSVIAIEPSPANAARLATHITMNSRTNVKVLQVAAGRENGTARLHVDVDPAFGAAVTGVAAVAQVGRTVSVQIRTLDDIWIEQGCPKVDLIKIDVEGGESEVILGAERILDSCSPVILAEAATEAHLTDLRSKLAKFNYISHSPTGFQPWNYIFTPTKKPTTR